ncbi:hypothetical protein [Nocardia noduli]|uniref:hypothetical protein n=1 Tax=Nocardia noduli TaxID=2815722 RepID=UPI001C241416|nr:hypothetical protein [Nocardia noduli]
MTNPADLAPEHQAILDRVHGLRRRTDRFRQVTIQRRNDWLNSIFRVLPKYAKGHRRVEVSK